MTRIVGFVLVSAGLLLASSAQQWPAYGGSPEGSRYSSLAQINRENVKALAVAWTYDTGETGGFQVHPIVVNGVLYANTPRHRVIALDAATGGSLPAWTSSSTRSTRGRERR